MYRIENDVNDDRNYMKLYAIFELSTAEEMCVIRSAHRTTLM